jgi:intracellular sulfur oxidation DsrE/DsrF family protein
MENPFLVIGVAHDGLAQEADGKERQEFENLVRMLLSHARIPATLCFYTEGVRWLTRESPFIEELKEIRARGADIVACRATVAEAGLLGDLAVGRLTTPDHIDDMLLQAEHAMVL